MSSKFKNVNAARNTETRDVSRMVKDTGTIYETIAVLAKRSNQISTELKEELSAKLEEFATSQDNLEEIFENREQIEISKYYERLPKPHSIAIQELLEDKIYTRRPDEDLQDAPAEA